MDKNTTRNKFMTQVEDLQEAQYPNMMAECLFTVLREGCLLPTDAATFVRSCN